MHYIQTKDVQMRSPTVGLLTKLLMFKIEKKL